MFKQVLSFPVYSPDMPKRLPIKDIISGLLCSLGTAVRFWLHYTLVAVAWLGIVPLTACKYYKNIYKTFSEWNENVASESEFLMVYKKILSWTNMMETDLEFNMLSIFKYFSFFFYLS